MIIKFLFKLFQSMIVLWFFIGVTAIIILITEAIVSVIPHDFWYDVLWYSNGIIACSICAILGLKVICIVKSIFEDDDER